MRYDLDDLNGCILPLAGDPRQHIEAIEDVSFVMKDGVIYKQP